MVFTSLFRSIFISLFLFLTIVECKVYAGVKLRPIVVNYSKEDYGAANQNWSIDQDSLGYIYVANNEGVLCFDGHEWELIKISRLKYVRSLYVAQDNKIFVGGFEEFGYLERDDYGELFYTSLSSELPKDEVANDEVWRIMSLDDKVLFQTFASFYSYDGESVKRHATNFAIVLFCKHQNDIYVSSSSGELAKLDKETNTFLFQPKSFQGTIVASVPYNDELTLFITENNGLFLFDGDHFTPFSTDIDNFLEANQANRAAIIGDSIIAIGTTTAGVIAINKSGQFMWHEYYGEKLQNNTILDMLCDVHNNLWLAMDNGVAQLKMNGPEYRFLTFKEDIGSIYDIEEWNGGLYVATNSGLLYMSKENNWEPQRISGVVGQVWYIKRLGNQLICGNNRGSFLIDKQGRIRHVGAHAGGAAIAQGEIRGKAVAVEGSYSHLSVYSEKDGIWSFDNGVEGFSNPIRFIEIDHMGVIWASHIHKGLFRIELNRENNRAKSVEYFETLDSTGINEKINLFKLNNQLVFTNYKRFYQFDAINKKMLPYDVLNEGLGLFQSAHRVVKSDVNHYWFITHKEAALFYVDNSEVRCIDRISYAVYHNEYVDDYQNIYRLDTARSLICLNNEIGLYRHNNASLEGDKKVKIKSIEAYGKNGVYHRFPLSSTITFPYKFNNIVFSIAPFYRNGYAISTMYYRIIGVDKEWQELKEEINCVALSDGQYKLEIVSAIGSKPILSYSFTVDPPFYRTYWAYIIYVLLLFSLIYIVAMIVNRRAWIKQKQRMKRDAERQRSVLENKEKHVMKLTNQNLRVEIDEKSKELALSAISAMQTEQLLLELKKLLTEQKEALGTHYPDKYFNKVVGVVNSHLSGDETWKLFETNFDKIQGDFFKNLKIAYPRLTSNDLRLCAFLRLNMHSKDIALLSNISLKGVEVARSRLKKKLNLSSDDNLVEFIICFDD